MLIVLPEPNLPSASLSSHNFQPWSRSYGSAAFSGNATGHMGDATYNVMVGAGTGVRYW